MVQISSSDTAGTQPLSAIGLYPGGTRESIILKTSVRSSNGTVFGDGSSQILAEKA